MDKRCKHKTFSIIEHCDAIGVWEIAEGVMFDEAVFEYGDYASYIDVRCYECGMKRRFNRYKKLPKWLHPYVKSIGEDEEDSLVPRAPLFRKWESKRDALATE